MLSRRRFIVSLGLICSSSCSVVSHAAADNADRIVISGASGQLGRLVVKELLGRGVDPKNLILTSRSPDALAEYAKLGATVRYADLYKPETLPSAFAGGTRMLLISIGASSTPRPEAHKAGFDAAVNAGVKHIVYTSFLGAGKAEPSDSPIVREHQQSEKYLRASGAKWTLLRNGYYADIHVLAATEMAKTGKAMLPAQDSKSAAVTRADCAAAAAGALLEPSSSENQAFDVTGPELYGRADVIEAVSAMIGRTIEVARLSPGAENVPIPFGPPASTPQIMSEAVRQLAGRPPMGLQALLDANKEQILAAAKGGV